MTGNTSIDLVGKSMAGHQTTRDLFRKRIKHSSILICYQIVDDWRRVITFRPRENDMTARDGEKVERHDVKAAIVDLGNRAVGERHGNLMLFLEPSHLLFLTILN
jgi:hypothetical protein